MGISLALRGFFKGLVGYFSQDFVLDFHTIIVFIRALSMSSHLEFKIIIQSYSVKIEFRGGAT